MSRIGWGPIAINTTLNNHAPIKIKTKLNTTLIESHWPPTQLENLLKLK